MRRTITASTAILLAALSIVGGWGSVAAAGTVAEEPDVVREILFPIAGDTYFSDTFGACRSGCSRGHEGTDLMADQLTPIVAVRDATVRYVSTDATPDGSRGNNVFLVDDDGWQYWYIHLNNDTPGTDDGANPPEWILGPGIERGARVRAGQLLGFVGDSGNAEWAGHHLHFEIHDADGFVINPYASLLEAPRVAAPLNSGGGVAEIASTPTEAFVDALFADFLGRAPSDVERAERTAAVEEAADRRSVVDEFTSSDAWIAALIDGYYRSTLGRAGDDAGTEFWTRVLRAGRTPASVAAEFYASDEYHLRVGGEDAAWIEDLYAELLDREAEEEGLIFWLDTLEAGVTRSEVARDFYQSAESRRTRVANLYKDLLGRSPDEGGLLYWAEVLTDGRDLALAAFLASSDEYFHRAGTSSSDDSDGSDAEEQSETSAQDPNNPDPENPDPENPDPESPGSENPEV